jgi:hypothetical protein
MFNSKEKTYVADYNKKYYDMHKDKLLENAKSKKICDCCDKMVSCSNWHKHKSSKIHKKCEEIKRLKVLTSPQEMV